MKQQIADNLKWALGELGVRNEEVTVEPPSNMTFGDYSSNIALKLGKKLGKAPFSLAEEIVSKLPREEWIEKVQVLKPGFINFWISKHLHLEELQKIIADDAVFFESSLFKKKKIIYEFTDPNPFKEFHIGHLYSNAVGESLARITSFLGAEVRRANYYGDVGMHVAKSLWGLKRKIQEENITLEILERKPLKERIKFLGQSYAMGAQAYESDEKAKEEMKDINYAVFIAGQEYLKKHQNWMPQVDYKKFVDREKVDLDEINTLYTKGKEWSLEAFEEIYKILGTKFDFYYPESIVGEFGMKLVLDNVKKNIFTKSEGAIIFDGEKYGLHTRVFINSLGLPTYEAKELGLAPTKYKDFQYDKSYIVTGNEINDYFKVLLTALKQINPTLAEKTTHIGHGMVRLPEGKMSSRTGKIMTGESLIEAAKEEVKTLMKNTEVSESERKQVIERIAIGAVKFALLKQGIGTDIEFNIKESVSFTGNSGPYIQYTIVRCDSVINKASGDADTSNVKTSAPEEEALLRLLAQFPDIVFEAAQKISPHIIANYLFEVAQKFSFFYEKHPILQAQGVEKNTRILLTKATSFVLKRGLYLLGISSVEKM